MRQDLGYRVIEEELRLLFDIGDQLPSLRLEQHLTRAELSPRAGLSGSRVTSVEDTTRLARLRPLPAQPEPPRYARAKLGNCKPDWWPSVTERMELLQAGKARGLERALPDDECAHVQLPVTGSLPTQVYRVLMVSPAELFDSDQGIFVQDKRPRYEPPRPSNNQGVRCPNKPERNRWPLIDLPPSLRGSRF